LSGTKAELDRLKVPYWSMIGNNGPAAEQIFATTRAATWSSYIRLTNAAAASQTGPKVLDRQDPLLVSRP